MYLRGWIVGHAKHAAAVLETQLGFLAMQFRGTRDEGEREVLTSKYKQVVDALIAGGAWEEMPGFEDMLPDERMPAAFFDFWSIPMAHAVRSQ